MKNSKRILALLFALVMVFSLAAFGNKEEKPADGEKPAEEQKEDENKEGKETADAAGIAKVGIASTISFGKSKDLEDDKGAAQEDTMVAAVAFDKDGKVVKVEVDTAQNKADIKDDGTFDFDTEAKGKTKKELGADYNMKAASEIGKEWDEQMASLEEYFVGKTAEEIKNIETEESVPTDADLKASVTMKIDGYKELVAKAWDNAVEVENVEKIGLGIISDFGHGTKEKPDDKGASVEFNTTYARVALDAEGKVVKTIIDTAQNTVAYTADGKLETDIEAEGTTKKALGADYNMKAASEIGKEWDEQIAAFEDWTVGKTADEIKNLEVDESGKTADADLKASVTMSVNGYVEVVSEAIDKAK